MQQVVDSLCSVQFCEWDASTGVPCDACKRKLCVWCAGILFVHKKAFAFRCPYCRTHFGLHLVFFGDMCRAAGGEPIPMALNHALYEAIIWAGSQEGKDAAIVHGRFTLADIQAVAAMPLPKTDYLPIEEIASDGDTTDEDLDETVEPLPTLRRFTSISNLPASPPMSLYSNISDPIDFGISPPASQVPSPQPGHDVLPVPPVSAPLVHHWAEPVEFLDPPVDAAPNAQGQGGQSGTIE